MRASCALRAVRHAKRLQSHQFHPQLIVPAGLIERAAARPTERPRSPVRKANSRQPPKISPSAESKVSELRNSRRKFAADWTRVAKVSRGRGFNLH